MTTRFEQARLIRKAIRQPGLRYDLRCGRHSGIPACCIGWYITVWRLVGPGGFLPYTSPHWYHRWRPIEGVEYVRCPACKLRRRMPVPVTRCACGRRRRTA